MLAGLLFGAIALSISVLVFGLGQRRCCERRTTNLPPVLSAGQ